MWPPSEPASLSADGASARRCFWDSSVRLSPDPVSLVSHAFLGAAAARLVLRFPVSFGSRLSLRNGQGLSVRYAGSPADTGTLRGDRCGASGTPARLETPASGWANRRRKNSTLHGETSPRGRALQAGIECELQFEPSAKSVSMCVSRTRSLRTMRCATGLSRGARPHHVCGGLSRKTKREGCNPAR